MYNISKKIILYGAFHSLTIEDKKLKNHELQALKDEDLKVRIFAAYALGNIGDKAAALGLTEALKQEQNTQIKKALQEALTKANES